MRTDKKEHSGFSVEFFKEKPLRNIAEKVFENRRISSAEALVLFEKASLGQLSVLADFVARQYHGDRIYYIRNFHIEPTNICVYHCHFCAYSKKPGESGSYEMTLEEIAQKVASAPLEAREVHITGGAHPAWNPEYYGTLLRIIRKIRPEIHIKAYSAVEIHHMHEQSGMDYPSLLVYLKDCGLNSLPGGGAEIFNPEIRRKICPEKVSGKNWLEIHRTAHNLGIPSGATMLYGHIEEYHHRIEHLEKLRELQDETGGFTAFIPLKFRNSNNRMSYLPEVSVIEDLRNYAVARIFLDNFRHIKAYWVMLGKTGAQLSLNFGVDDLDGTIEDTTRIYSSAGVTGKAAMAPEEICTMITQAGKIPAERDALYNLIS